MKKKIVKIVKILDDISGVIGIMMVVILMIVGGSIAVTCIDELTPLTPRLLLWTLLFLLGIGVGFFLSFRALRRINFKKTQSPVSQTKSSEPLNPWVQTPKVQVEKKEEEKEIPPIWGSKVLAGG